MDRDHCANMQHALLELPPELLKLVVKHACKHVPATICIALACRHFRERAPTPAAHTPPYAARHATLLERGPWWSRCQPAGEVK